MLEKATTILICPRIHISNELPTSYTVFYENTQPRMIERLNEHLSSENGMSQMQCRACRLHYVVLKSFRL